ncbi:hypothetical protein ACET3Z_003393 [Daucus carota]
MCTKVMDVQKDMKSPKREHSDTIARLIESGDSEQIFQKAIQEQARGQGIGILLSGLFGTGNGSSVSMQVTLELDNVSASYYLSVSCSETDAVRVKGQNGSKFNTFQVYFGIIRGGSELFSLVIVSTTFFLP